MAANSAATGGAAEEGPWRAGGLLAGQPAAVDLFSGAGGFSLGLARAGFRVLGAVDVWDPACRTYALNFGHPLVKSDIRELSAARFWQLIEREPAPVDLLVGGPPCQGFSIQRIGG